MKSSTQLDNRQVVNFGVPWEDAFGYAQAVQLDGIIYISGQLSHQKDGTMVAPAQLDDVGKPMDFYNMEAQLRRTYENAVDLLAQFGATLDDVVEETLYVLDVDAAFQAASKVRKEMYRTDRPRVASNLIGVSRLAFPEQLVEVAFRAVVRRERAD
jgi:enamine deaminase RidA (YjgF/YER057c/UK114 family)